MTARSPLAIRARHPEDLKKLGEILVRVHDSDGYPVEGITDPETWLVPPREIAAWTAILNNEPIGQISLTRADLQDDAAQVWVNSTGGEADSIAIPVRLFIDPAHRGHGAGRELMLVAAEHAASLGKHVVFDVMLKDEHAIRLYQALGCHRLGTITHHHGGNRTEPAAVYVAPQPRRADD